MPDAAKSPLTWSLNQWSFLQKKVCFWQTGCFCRSGIIFGVISVKKFSPYWWKEIRSEKHHSRIAREIEKKTCFGPRFLYSCQLLLSIQLTCLFKFPCKKFLSVTKSTIFHILFSSGLLREKWCFLSFTEELSATSNIQLGSSLTAEGCHTALPWDISLLQQKLC